MADGGGGSNTTHALLSPDPETLPIGEVFRPAKSESLGTKGLQGQPTVAPLCSSKGKSELPSEPEIWPRHYPLGVGS